MSEYPAPVTVFCGPSISADRVRDLVGNAEVRPPVGHGDLIRLGQVAGARLVIIDGYYFQTTPLRLREICWAMAQGALIVGAASIGALRACELADLGMIGSGRIYEWYRDGRIRRDDEVAVAQAMAEEDYRSLSIPLVNVRHWLECARAENLLGSHSAERIIAATGQLYFPDRTARALTGIFSRHAGHAAATFLRDCIADPDRDLKLLDASAAVARAADPRLRPVVDTAVSSASSYYLTKWLASEARVDVGSLSVSRWSVVRALQMFDPCFKTGFARMAASQLGSIENWLASDTDALVPPWLGDDDLTRMEEWQRCPHWSHDSMARIVDALDCREAARSTPPTVSAPEALSAVWQLRERSGLPMAAKTRGFPRLSDATIVLRKLLSVFDWAEVQRLATRW